VQRYNELDLRFPRRAYGGAWDGKLLWGRLTHSRVLGILANPFYAGAYVFGRHQSSKQVGSSGEIRTRSRLMPQDAWRVVIPDHREAYISADQFIANRQRLSTNRTNAEGLSGPAREGLCLLQGLLLCGGSGRRLGVPYTGNGGIYPLDQCVWKHREALASRACLTAPSTSLDQAISERLVSAITPVTIELALAALANLEERDRGIGAQWRMRIECARYDAELAERRYEAVDPCKPIDRSDTRNALERRHATPARPRGRIGRVRTQDHAGGHRRAEAADSPARKRLPSPMGRPQPRPLEIVSAFCACWCATSP
jgi:hypothetical protein